LQFRFAKLGTGEFGSQRLLLLVKIGGGGQALNGQRDLSAGSGVVAGRRAVGRLLFAAVDLTSDHDFYVGAR
jgi:hypothetical protein